MSVERALESYRDNRRSHLDDLATLVRIPSVGAPPPSPPS